VLRDSQFPDVVIDDEGKRSTGPPFGRRRLFDA